jgi:phosphoserine aminotransferase
MSKIHNFSAGPSILPQEVFEQASKAVLGFENVGLSLLEVSHRSKEVVAMVDRTIALVKELLNVPEGYAILFLQGGASMQFYMSALNYMKEGGKGGYIDTGVWSAKAIKEAKKIGTVVEVASSKDRNYSYIPKGYSVPTDLDFLHYTTNNTIYGTEFFETPKSPVPLLADMSSDIFSREFSVADHALIYAGAQKNMGPAGVTLVIVKEELLGKTGRNLPSMLDYQVHIKGESMFNTPPVFPIYVSMLTLQWLKNKGGVAWAEQNNKAKADLFYNELDRNSLFVGTAAKEDRSRMNATFLLKDESLDADFNAALKAANISGLKGHRDVGGFRASMYNALPLESVQVLVDVMRAFEQQKG